MKTAKSDSKKSAFTPFGSQKVLKDARKKAAVEFQLDPPPHRHPSMYDPVEAPEPSSNWSPPKSWGWE